jgi:hypothetical protein
MDQLFTSGMIDRLPTEGGAFQELSYSRLGGYGAPDLAETLVRELKARKLARDTEDGVSIPMHPAVRALVLVLLSQILRPKGPELGLELSPATDQPRLVEALCELLSVPRTPTAGHVVQFDLETVCPDLSAMPLDEVLDFRKLHSREFREYSRYVRKFVREISQLPDREQAKAFGERQEEIRDLAADLKRKSRKAWKKPASFAFSIAGAAWTLAMGDPLGALLAGGAAALGIENGKREVTAYSYLFAAQMPYF